MSALPQGGHPWGPRLPMVRHAARWIDNPAMGSQRHAETRETWLIKLRRLAVLRDNQRLLAGYLPVADVNPRRAISSDRGIADLTRASRP